jgi:hypothetical protein
MDHVPPIEYWFTVPATWSERTRDRMLEVLQTAGYSARDGDSVLLLSEAEAAAAGVLDDMPRLQVGQEYSPVLCLRCC